MALGSVIASAQTYFLISVANKMKMGLERMDD